MRFHENSPSMMVFDCWTTCARRAILGKMHCFNGRVLKPEILDTLPTEEARGTLADLARINKHWGGHSTLRKLVDDVIPSNEAFTFLDVGSASGDMGRCLREWRPRAK